MNRGVRFDPASLDSKLLVKASRSLNGSKRSTVIHLPYVSEPATLAGSQSLCNADISTLGGRVLDKFDTCSGERLGAAVAPQDCMELLATGRVGDDDGGPVQGVEPPLSPLQRGRQHGEERQSFRRQPVLGTVLGHRQDAVVAEGPQTVGDRTGRRGQQLLKPENRVVPTNAATSIAHAQRLPSTLMVCGKSPEGESR